MIWYLADVLGHLGDELPDGNSQYQLGDEPTGNMVDIVSWLADTLLEGGWLAAFISVTS